MPTPRKAPSDEGKRSAVAVVNDSPVGCQSRDRAARRRLSPLSGDWGREQTFSLPPPSLPLGHLPHQREAFTVPVILSEAKDLRTPIQPLSF